jgi:hypothetical protein
MRVLQLLAIATVCPLALVAVGCGRIVQPVGEYQAASTHPVHNAPTLDANVEQGPTEITEPTTPDDEPVLPSDAGAAAAAAGASSTPGFPSPSNPIRIPNISITLPIPPKNSACQPSMSRNAVRKRVDMYIMIDANITLPYTGLWEFVIDGLRQFINDRSTVGTGVGIRFYGMLCDDATYNTQPTVEVATVPDNVDDLLKATLQKPNYTASPMKGALQGAIYHQVDRATHHPEAKQVVVLLTDGVTQDLTCRYTMSDLEDIAREGFNNTTNPIETYVVGFGLPDTMSQIADDILARFSPLESIASAGGTRTAQIVKTRQDPTPMADALQKVRRLAQPCEYAIPDDFDPAKLNLEFSPTSMVPRVDNKESCGQRAGFYYQYDADNLTRPASLQLCPVSCLAISDDDYTATLLGGCPTVRR